MEASASSQPERHISNPTDDTSRGQHHRRSRRARGNGSGLSASRRADVFSADPLSTPPGTDAGASAGPARGRGRGRGRGGGRGHGRGTNQNRTVNGREFGGQLTNTDSETLFEQPSSPAQLQASAPVFEPGKQFIPPQIPPKQPKPRRRRESKSQAPDIARRTHEDIDHGHYECAVCFSTVQRNSKVWSCHDCWTVFHLGCIKKWFGVHSSWR